jgi:putative addiction module killer protein
MMEVRQTAEFTDWMRRLADERAKARIASRIDRLKAGNRGDAKSIGSGISELRIDYGPGYRVYYAMRGRVMIVLLCGGDKSTQKTDIQLAKKIADRADRLEK